MKAPGEDWPSYQRLVLKQLDDLNAGYKELHSSFEDLRVEVVRLKEAGTTKATLVGLLGGLVPAVTYILFQVFGD